MKVRPTIGNIRPAGTNDHGDHQVVTIVGRLGNTYCRRPCPTCPWRKDAVGQFPAEAFRHSATTAYDQAFNVFACHTTGVENPSTCAGFILSGARHNIGVRLQIMQGKIGNDIAAGDVELFPSYRAMAEANGVAPDDPILAPCRED
ncbi:DUF6283 family protein [Massilia sp. P8910]|uniref:DUF6283 family protein n=1 Tax=Massilia antarctica TaxID=2765360 RepID=UPI001E415E9B|nr:DUF6283 family protein [Massilia antarctica]MCE3602761.1 DUF6283 family protein [Massilia antarctica]